MMGSQNYDAADCHEIVRRLGLRISGLGKAGQAAWLYTIL